MQQVSPLALTVPAALAFVLLVLATGRAFGWRLTAQVTTAAVGFFFLKEFLNIRGLLVEHHYVVDAGFLHIGRVSPSVVMGHAFTVLVGLHVGRRLARLLPGIGSGFALYLFALVSVTTAMAYAMEATGISAGWWHWLNLETRETVPPPDAWIVAPDLAMKGWAAYMCLFYMGLFPMLGVLQRRWGPRAAWFALLTTPLTLGLVFGDWLAVLVGPLLILTTVVVTFRPRWDWTAAIEEKPLGNRWLDAVARWGFPVATALVFAVCAPILWTHGRTLDPRVMVALLPLAILILGSRYRRPLLITAGVVPVLFLVFYALGELHLAYALRIPLTAILAISGLALLRRALNRLHGVT